MSFYDKISVFYDDMFPWDQRLKNQTKVFRKFLRAYPLISVLEAGCGTGLQSIALAGLDIQVTGIDMSPEMVKLAREHAAQAGVPVRFETGSFEDIPTMELKPLDGVFCLGNVIPHITGQDELLTTLNIFYSLLKPGGILVLQLLNYLPILQKQERILAIDQRETDEYIRFYDFLENGLIRFNILNVKKGEGRKTHSLESTLLKPYTAGDILPSLKRTGFNVLETNGELGESFDPESSFTLSLIAERPIS